MRGDKCEGRRILLAKQYIKHKVHVRLWGFCWGFLSGSCRKYKGTVLIPELVKVKQQLSHMLRP